MLQKPKRKENQKLIGIYLTFLLRIHFRRLKLRNDSEKMGKSF